MYSILAQKILPAMLVAAYSNAIPADHTHSASMSAANHQPPGIARRRHANTATTAATHAAAAQMITYGVITKFIAWDSVASPGAP